MPPTITGQGQRRADVKMAVILFFIVWPLGALPVVLMEIRNRQRYAFALLALFMGLCAVLIPPGSDLYRHTMEYFDFRLLSWDAFLSIRRVDFVLYYISYFFASAGINFEMVRFLFVAAYYAILFYIFRDAVARNKTLATNRSWYFTGFLLVMFCACFFQVTLGMRWGLAYGVSVLSGWNLLVQKRRAGYMWLLLAPMIHFAAVIFSVVILLMKLRILRFRRKWPIVAFLVAAYLSSSLLMPSVLPILMDMYGRGTAYITGDWASAAFVNLSFAGWVVFITVMSRQVLLLVPFFSNRDQSVLRSLIFAVIVLWGFCMPFYALGLRISNVLVQLLVFWLVLEFNTAKRYLSMFKVVVTISALLFCFEIYAQREHVMLSRLDKMLYSSAPVLMFNTFDETWVYNNVDKTGTFK